MDNGIFAKLNSPLMYLIAGIIILFIAGVCVLFMVRAYRQGKRIGMDTTKMKRVITSSATFAVLPSVGILLGVIALSGSLGTPLPWLRLSVIGALHYETQVADAASRAVGLTGLNATEMTGTAFSTIALLMTFCIMWGMVFSVIFSKRYLKKLKNTALGGEGGGFGDRAMTAMFIGLVSAYIGNYIGQLVSGNGLFAFRGDLLPLIVTAVGALSMAGFVYLAEKKAAAWVENFSIAGSMLIAMAAAVLIRL